MSFGVCGEARPARLDASGYGAQPGEKRSIFVPHVAKASSCQGRAGEHRLMAPIALETE